MVNLIPKHSFEVKAHFEKVIMLTFAVPKEDVLPLIPSCLELDDYDNKWGFITLAFVKAKDLRPVRFPKFMGSDLILSGYRIFVKYKENGGRCLRGIYIIKSETDSLKMKLMGNILTHYNYSFSDLELNQDLKGGRIKSTKAGFDIQYENYSENLPSDSPFPDWKIARKFVGPLPNTFSYNEEKKEVLIIRGRRGNWNPKPIKITEYTIPFLGDLNFSKIKLANAFQIEDVPYMWDKARKEKLNE